jgi:hypothetical protein
MNFPLAFRRVTDTLDFGSPYGWWWVKRVGAIIGIVLCAIAAYSYFGRASVATPPSSGPYWERQDQAAYVVSTLNLLRSRTGRSIVASWQRSRYSHRFSVYADTRARNLYFIEVDRMHNDARGVLVYRLGWQRPRAITPWPKAYRVRAAPRSLMNAFRRDPKALIGSFSSILYS